MKARKNIKARFGAVIRCRREELGLSQEKLAELAELHRNYVGGIERGERNVALINIERLAKALGWSIAELFVLVEREE